MHCTPSRTEFSTEFSTAISTAIPTVSNSLSLQGKIVDQRLELELGIEEFEVAAAGGRDAHAPNIDGFKVWTTLHQCEQSRLRHMAATPKVDALEQPTVACDGENGDVGDEGAADVEMLQRRGARGELHHALVGDGRHAP